MNITGNINHVGYDQWLQSPYENEGSYQSPEDKIANAFWDKLETEKGAGEFVYDHEPSLESNLWHAVAFARGQLMEPDSNRQEILEGMYTHLVNLMDEFINEQAEWKANKGMEA